MEEHWEGRSDKMVRRAFMNAIRERSSKSIFLEALSVHLESTSQMIRVKELLHSLHEGFLCSSLEAGPLAAVGFFFFLQQWKLNFKIIASRMKKKI